MAYLTLTCVARSKSNIAATDRAFYKRRESEEIITNLVSPNIK